MTRIALILLTPLFLLAGCDRLEERLNIPNPAKIEADAKAVGGACRHAGRGLEDCYQLNPKAPKAAVFEGWKEMNEYMLEKNMQAVVPEFVPKPAEPEARLERDADPAQAAPTQAAPDQAAPAKGSQDKPRIDLPSRQALEKAAQSR